MCSSVMSLCCPMFVYCEPNLLRRRLSDLLKESYRSKVAFCIPILVDSSIAYDVSKRQTPEMVEQAKRMAFAMCISLVGSCETVDFRCFGTVHDLFCALPFLLSSQGRPVGVPET